MAAWAAERHSGAQFTPDFLVVSIEEMMEVQAGRCRAVAEDREAVRRRTAYGWWPPDRG